MIILNPNQFPGLSVRYRQNSTQMLNVMSLIQKGILFL